MRTDGGTDSLGMAGWEVPLKSEVLVPQDTAVCVVKLVLQGCEVLVLALVVMNVVCC